MVNGGQTAALPLLLSPPPLPTPALLLAWSRARAAPNEGERFEGQGKRRERREGKKRASNREREKKAPSLRRGPTRGEVLPADLQQDSGSGGVHSVDLILSPWVRRSKGKFEVCSVCVCEGGRSISILRTQTSGSGTTVAKK